MLEKDRAGNIGKKRLKISEVLKRLASEGVTNPQQKFKKNNSGWVDSKKGGKVYCASGWEKIRVNTLDNNPLVSSFQKDKIRIKYEILGVIHVYIVDFLIKYENRELVLEEVKPKLGFYDSTETEVSKAKFIAARKHCILNGWTFRVIDTKESLLDL